MMKAYASGGSGTKRGVVNQNTAITRPVTTTRTGNRTWKTRFAFNGTQISSDGKYQITPIDAYPGVKRYELSKSTGRGFSRVGVYNSLDSAKNHAT